MSFSTWFIANFRLGYEADLAAYVFGMVLVLLLLAYKTYYWHTVSKKERSHYITHTFITLGFIVIFTFLLYSAYYYWYSNVATEGIIVCSGDECKWAAHIHAYIEELIICEQQVYLPFDAGRLDEAHAHKDGKIHWHDLLSVDKSTGKPISTKPLNLGTFFDQIGWKFDENCLKDTCECEGRLAILSVTVQRRSETFENIRQTVANPRDYVWKDGDRFRIALT